MPIWTCSKGTKRTYTLAFSFLALIMISSAELSEPELLIVFKDDLDLSSYPPWHIRLTEILYVLVALFRTVLSHTHALSSQ